MREIIQNFPSRYSVFSCLLRRIEVRISYKRDTKVVANQQTCTVETSYRARALFVDGKRREAMAVICCCQQQWIGTVQIVWKGRRTAVGDELTDKCGRIPTGDLISASKIIIINIIIIIIVTWSTRW